MNAYSLIPLAVGLGGIGLFVFAANAYYSRKYSRATYNGTQFAVPDLYVTCGYCGQSVPASDGFNCNPHKYTVDQPDTGVIRLDCPQGRA